ncbi:hypothetical protein Lal_00006393 [Lupinus albus]|uniref:Uncharacterized protein n=1 Tax=Lupinus albus TaxID=3870 RepID=A0A6A5MVT0_LUPAL|nr:hypothetical protein Lalb_Chr07g0184691 [Lupinus albus]KAF1875763.1 hypothetical protein Lal_00006393 [Lupinus albus]
MVVVHYKLILHVLFFILCFISMQARARALKEAHNKKWFDVKFKPKEDGEANEGEVFSMDYTPPRRKPPIHN